MRVLGIDPGFERLGIAIIEEDASGVALIYSHCFKTAADLPFNERLMAVGDEVARIIEKYHPEALAIETLFFNTNQKTAMMVSESRGVVLYRATRAGLTVYEYTPPQIKIAVAGYGKADKKQVAFMTKKLVAVGDEITSDDEIDAIATGLTCLASYKTIT